MTHKTNNMQMFKMKALVPGRPQPASFPATVRFLDIPVGGRFEFRGRRYEKVGGGFAADEERMGNCFQADTEVVMEGGCACFKTGGA